MLLNLMWQWLNRHFLTIPHSEELWNLFREKETNFPGETEEEIAIFAIFGEIWRKLQILESVCSAETSPQA